MPRSDVEDPIRRRRFLMPTVILVLLLSFVGFSIYLQERHEEGVSRARGDWELSFASLPGWFPEGFVGQLAALRDIPRGVPLHGSHWRDQVQAAIASNPWVAEVEWIRRTGDEISFQAKFVRPVVAVEGRQGFYLCDSRGGVIDLQRGDELSSRWRVPTYRPERGLLEEATLGEPLGSLEFDELLRLVNVLWDAGIYGRWADQLARLSTRREGGQDRLWVLEVEDGPDLDWGRAPGSQGVVALSDDKKIAHLHRTLRYLPELRDVPQVRLWDATGPLVGVQR
ncbi:MAG: hypothetical protein AAF581_12850 [Planctomycetota bacterium]